MQWKYAALILCTWCSCSPKLSPTDKEYLRQAKAYAKIISQYPVVDSAANTQFVATTNFNMRKPNYVIIHHTAQGSCEQTIKTFTLKRTEVSAHYVICRDGTVLHMLNDYLRAWHGGAARWGSITDINSVSIGIELDNNGSEPFAEPLITSLLDLLARLKQAYNIPTSNYIGHADIAPTRKNDPSKYFPWERLAASGYGYWYSADSVAVPAGFDAVTGLRLIGYDVRNVAAAVKAFKLHYNNTDTTATIGNKDIQILYKLSKK